MNSFIDSLNHLGARFADFALPMLVQSSLLIVLLFALDLALRNRVRAVVRYALWMLVLIKLVLPPSFAAPTSLAYWLSEKKAVKAPPAPSQQFVIRYSDAKFDGARPLPSLPPPRAKLQFAGWLLLAWLATAVGLMAWLVRRSRSVVQTAARAFPASESPEQLLDACRQQMGIKQRVRLKLSGTASSPAVFGLWRPVILIPQKLTDKLSALQLRAVLFHELAHIKRSDALVHYLQTLLQIIYWWHPLLWLANAQIRRVREQAVDEAVVVAMGSDAEAYLATLLEVAKLAFNRPTFALGLIGIVESKSALAQRVQHLLNRPIPKSARLGFTGLAALFLAGAAFLPMARGQRTPNQPQQVASESGQPQPVVAMDVRFIEIEESHLATVGLGEPTLTEFNGHRAWVLTPDQLNGVLQRVLEQTAADILTASRVTTFSGQQSQIQVLDSVPAYGTEIRVGPICDLIPYVSGELVDLAVVASVTEPRPVDPTAPFTSTADAFLTNEVGTARVIVGNGGGVVLENPEARSSKGNRYLVIVSATIVSAGRAAESQTLNQASTAATGAATRNQKVPAATLQNATRTPPTNSPKSQTSSTVTSSERQVATKRTYLNASSGAASSNFSARSRAENNVLPTPLAKSTEARPTGTATKGDASVGEGDQLTVTIAKAEPYFYFSYLTLAPKPASLEQLQAEFKRATSLNPAVALSIRADRDAPLGLIVKVADAAKQAGIKSVTLFTVPQTSGTDSLRASNTDGSMERNGAKSAERLLNQPANAPMENQSKPVSDGSVSSSISPRDRMPVLGDLPLFGPAREAIEAKLKQIILPEVIFDNVPLPEALRWLTEQARKHDPDGTGLNFLLNPNVIGAVQQTIIDPTTGQPVTLPSPQPLDINTVMLRINPPLKNVQLSDALEAIVHTADKPIRYAIEDYAVIFSQNQPGTAHLETRTFHVDPKAFIQHLQNKFAGAMESQQLFRRFFTATGVDVLPPNMVFFNDRRGTLMVRATPEELRRVQDAIDDLNAGSSKESGRKSPTGSSGATEGSTGSLQPKNAPGADAGKDSGAETDLLAWMRTYVCDELASLRLRLEFEVNGTYLASSEEYGFRHNETGTWKRKGGAFILERNAGDLQYAIRRLRVDDRHPTHLLWVPPISNPVGAIEYVSFKPVDENPAASNPSERSETEEPSAHKQSAALETRSFRLDPKTFADDAYRFLLDAGWSDTEIFGHSNDWKGSLIRKFCESLGVSRAPPNTIFYSDGAGWLMVRGTAEELERVQKAVEKLNALRQKESANQSPATSAKVGEVKVSRLNATEELVVAITAQYIYLGPQPVTLEMLKTKLAEAKGRNPSLWLVVKADQDAPVEQVGGVLAMARSLDIEPFSTKSSESDTKQLGFDWFLGNTLLSNGRMGIQGGTAPSFLGTPSLANPTGTIKLETRVFRVNPATLLEGLKNNAGVPRHHRTFDSIQDSVRDFFAAAGVNVQPPNALFYNDRTGVLLVRAPSEEMDAVEKVLEMLNSRPSQLTIEAKFMELPTEAAKQLGLEPPPPDQAANTWTRILTAADMRMVLRSAEQREGVDILSAPKITTLSGRQAQIQAVQTRTVVTGIDPKALAPPGVQSTYNVPAQLYLTSLVNCGPTLDVVATVGGDGCTIRLATLPQVTEFIRYDTTLSGANGTRVWVDGKQRNVPLPLPVIRTRQMQASAAVYDGQTLVLGGPTVTQVLQQSNSQSVTNAIPEDPGKRLVVFITATLIDPAGNPIHTPGHEPWSDKTPPQRQ